MASSVPQAPARKSCYLNLSSVHRRPAEARSVVVFFILTSAGDHRHFSGYWATLILNYSMRTTQLLIDDVELGSFCSDRSSGVSDYRIEAEKHILRLRRRQVSDAHIISDDTHEHCSHAPSSRSVAEREGVFGQYLFFNCVFNRLSSCSGAVIVLLFANSPNLFTAGLLSVLAMSLGLR